jgi:hypothetical protein
VALSNASARYIREVTDPKAGKYSHGNICGQSTDFFQGLSC